MKPQAVYTFDKLALVRVHFDNDELKREFAHFLANGLNADANVLGDYVALSASFKGKGFTGIYPESEVSKIKTWLEQRGVSEWGSEHTGSRVPTRE